MEFKKKYIKLIIIIASVSAVFAGAGAFSLVKYTTSVKHFCMSCHWNQGDSDFSKQSAIHPKYVSCDECHADNSEIIPTGFNASPELVNENCIRCHAEIQFTNEWKTLKTNAQEIRIEHEKHLKKVGLNCIDCHNNVAHDSSPNPTNRPHMAKCFECHVSREEGCETCHPLGFVKFDSEMEDISVMACSRCHMDFLRKESSRKEGFLHKKHLTSLLECNTCHDVNLQHPLSIIEDNDCGSCHHEKTEKVCIDCHPLQNKLYFGIRENEEWHYPDVMATAGMSCNIGCHVDLKSGHSFKSVKQACITCHGEEYGGLVDEFQISLNQSIDEIKRLLSDTIELNNKNNINREEVEDGIESSEKILNFIEKAKGIHNMQYTLLLVNDLEKRSRNLYNMVLEKQ
ncbi:MAG: hypothetical protein JYX80_11300 [Candidatus Scalindua sediminis]|nr:hypothetical protein [Candidatus Scalindua sediminis]